MPEDTSPEQTPTRPERDEFYSMTAQILANGITLLPTEVAEIAVCYGYSEKLTGHALMASYAGQKALVANGTTLSIDIHRGQRIYRDKGIDPKDTDSAISRRIIDERWEVTKKERAERRAAKQSNAQSSITDSVE